MPIKNISVVIPCYNEEKNIRKCLETILDQSVTDYEVIVVDDGSTDKTKDIIREFNVRLLEQDHRGPGTARNWGGQEAMGEILVFVDADMFFDKEFLEKLVRPILNGTAIGTFNKDELVGNDDNDWAVCWNLELTGTKKRRILENHQDESIIYRAILRAEFLRVGGFDTKVGYEDDATLYPKLGKKAQFAPSAICYHNNPGSAKEVFQSARWIGRSIRFSENTLRLLKFLQPITLYFALRKAIKYRLPFFLFLKLFLIGE